MHLKRLSRIIYSKKENKIALLNIKQSVLNLTKKTTPASSVRENGQVLGGPSVRRRLDMLHVSQLPFYFSKYTQTRRFFVSLGVHTPGGQLEASTELKWVQYIAIIMLQVLINDVLTQNINEQQKLSIVNIRQNINE